MVLEALTDYLAAQGCGTVGVDLFRGGLPPTPDQALVLTLYGGLPPQLVHGQPIQGGYEQPRVQVRARALSWPDAYVLAERAYVAFLRLANVQLGGVWYLSVMPLQPPFDLGLDDQGRQQAGFNAEATRALTVR